MTEEDKLLKEIQVLMDSARHLWGQIGSKPLDTTNNTELKQQVFRCYEEMRKLYEKLEELEKKNLGQET